MASHFDELDRRNLNELNKNVKILMEQVARIQDRLDRKYLRQVIKRQREKIILQKGYISELESRLRL